MVISKTEGKLSNEEIERLTKERTRICLGLSELLYAVNPTKFDRNSYLTLSAMRYETPVEDVARVLEVGEEIYGTGAKNLIKVLDYVGEFFIGKEHLVCGRNLEQTARDLRKE